MKSLLVRGFFIVLGFTLFTLASARADEQPPSRQIIGGDILYTGHATHHDQAKALILAQNRATTGLVVECSKAPAESKLFKHGAEFNILSKNYEATVQVGVGFSECEAMRKRLPAQQAATQNAKLMADLNEEGKTNSGELTILGHMIVGKFGDLFGRMDVQDKKLDSVDQKVGDLNDKVEVVDQKVDRVEARSVAAARKVASEAVKAPSDAANKACWDQYQYHMNQYQRETGSRPGMPSQRAFDSYNMAQTIKRGCH